MGLFKKKDPISERAKALNEQIAALQAQIEHLSDNPEVTEGDAPRPTKGAKPFSEQAANTPAKPTSSAPPPRLRSTAIPQREVARRAQRKAPPPPPPPRDPVFEEVGQAAPDESLEQQPSVAHYNDLGVRKYDLASLWKRWTTHFRGPATNNPKLVNYLAAGSIQGLRPLRYEKRVARNRFVFFVLILIAVLWGLIAIWYKRS